MTIVIDLIKFGLQEKSTEKRIKITQNAIFLKWSLGLRVASPLLLSTDRHTY